MKLKPTITVKPMVPRPLATLPAAATGSAPWQAPVRYTWRDADELLALMDGMKERMRDTLGTPPAILERARVYLSAPMYDHFAPLPSWCVRVAPGIAPWQANR